MVNTRFRTAQMNITAVTCVKNEGPFLLEWIAFNHIIGVTDFLFYSNDCDDGTDLLLDALAQKGIVRHLPNPAKGRAYQMEALKDAQKQPVVANADWVWVADVDEFLNIHVGAHRIPDLIEACGNPHAISLHFQYFSNNDIYSFEDTPIIEQFLYSHNPDILDDDTAIEVKTLTRCDFPLHYFGAHRPFLPQKLPPNDHPDWTDGSGRPVPHRFFHATTKKRIRKFTARGSRSFATLNHYALRSLDSYLVKNERGDVNREGRPFDTNYWQKRNDNAYFDNSILRYQGELRDKLSDLKSIPEIAELHTQAVNRHIEKIQKLKSQSQFLKLYSDLQNLTKIPPNEAKLISMLGLPDDLTSR